MKTTKTILGIDFSGAALAGRKIWVSHATQSDEALQFHELTRGADLPQSGEERECVFPALVSWLRSFEAPVCGFDFPLSLPAASVGDDWQAWLQTSVVPCADADEFRSRFEDARRRCDIAAKTPFSPLNKRLYRQTFHGLRDVIFPLLQSGAVALPFDGAQSGAPWLLEICPASLLKREKLYFSYKGRSEAQRANRETIWDAMAERTPFTAPESTKTLALEDDEGDALDAVLAALCVARALHSNSHSHAFTARDAIEKREGRVYF